MSPVEIAKRLNKEVPLVAKHLFKGAASERGGRYHIGNIQGDPGESLVLYINSGRWKEFGSGQGNTKTEEGGDMLELLTLRYGDKSEAIKVAHEILGIANTTMNGSSKRNGSASSEKVEGGGKQLEWTKPIKDWNQLTENPAVVEYLTKDRKIPLEVLKHAGVRAKEDEWYIFICKTHDDPPIPCGAFKVALTRIKNEKSGKLEKQIKQSKNPLPTLYGHDTCDMAVKNRDHKTYLIVTGGQIDMLSYRTVGLKNSVSVPSGETSYKWIEASWDFLMKFQEIYISMDNDEAGRLATEKIAQKIGYDRCHKCVIPSHYTDANEALLDDYDLHLAVKNAVEFKPTRLVSAGELAEEAIGILVMGRREDQGIPFVGWTGDESVRFNIRPREMTIVTGYAGSGKSTILYQQAAYLACVEKKKLYIASLEEDPAVILGLIAIQAMAMQYDKDDRRIMRGFDELMKYLDSYIYFYDFRGRASATEVLKNAEYTIRKYGVDHVIFDSVAKTDLDIENNKDCNEFVGMITNSMTQTGAHYYLVAHSRKGNDHDFNEIPGLQEIKGSNALGVETFNCITVWRNNAKAVMLKKAQATGTFESRKAKDENGQYKRSSIEEIKQKGDSILWVNKQKVGGQVGRYDLFYNEDCYRLERTFSLDSKPYATDIYEEFIGEKVIAPPSF